MIPHLAFLLACADDKASEISDTSNPDDTGAVTDSGDSGDSADSADSGDTGAPPEPLARWSGETTLDAADQTLWLGEKAGDRLGRTVMRGGDFDGDGYDDLALGAYYWSDDIWRKGRAWLLPGPIAPGDGDLDGAVLTVSGEAETEFVSRSLAGGADLDGDGLDDLLVGSPNHGGGTGRSCVWRGGSAGSYAASEADTCITGYAGLFGAFGTMPGDMDGDGQPDLLISAIYGTTGGENAGEVSFVAGPVADGTWASTDAEALLSGAATDEAGWFTSRAGDLDGDGYDDAWVGAPGHDEGTTEGGAVWLIRGPIAASGALSDVAAARITGDQIGTQAGRALAGGEDLDGDGGPDLLVGGPAGDAGDGVAWVFLDPPTSGEHLTSAADLTLASDLTGAAAGWGLALPGDLDQDGYGELLVGVYGGESATLEGRASLFYGPPTGANLSEADATFLGGEIGDFAGWFVSGAGDATGDGAPDLFIGAQRSDQAGDEAGRAHLLSGVPSGG